MTSSIPPLILSPTSSLSLPSGPAGLDSDGSFSDGSFSDELGRAQSRQSDSSSSADQSQGASQSSTPTVKPRSQQRQAKNAADAKSAAAATPAKGAEDPEAADAADPQAGANADDASLPGAEGSPATDTPSAEHFDHIIANQTADTSADAPAEDSASTDAAAAKPATLLPVFRDGLEAASDNANPAALNAEHPKTAQAKAANAPDPQQLNLQQIAAGQNGANPLNPNAPAGVDGAADGDGEDLPGNASGIGGKLHISPFDNGNIIGGNTIGLPGDDDASADDSTGDEFAASLEDAIGGSTATSGAADHHSGDKALAGLEAQLLSPTPTPNVATSSPVLNAATAAQTPTPQSPDAAFAAANHPSIVSGIHGQLLPGGGTMQIRLDPPEMGAMQITVKMQGGALSASFQTSNDEATRMLSHSLGKLKESLESQGVSVTQLHVQRASPSESSSGSSGEDNSKQQNSSEGQTAQQEQQRKEMMRKMWRRVSGAGDPLDMVA